ncbi:FliM/FliN family flagellar motor C-terminal domain-containing protein [Enterobacter ludwigii]|uniref:FliM/FliN family flagellar motor C-terminal domain-containing protein n=1 Tax=Enterobacter ludwigii TaxID=299767 RepID=UPI003F72847F
MNSASKTFRIYHRDALLEVKTLDPKKLGRPWHKLPKMINDRFDTIDAKISIYFLKKLRVNVSLKNVTFGINQSYRNTQIFATPHGHVAISIERSLLLNILYDYYGARHDNHAGPLAANEKTTKTEERLRLKIGKDLISLLLDGDDSELKTDNSMVMNTWAWCVTYTLSDYEYGSFTLLFDEKHVDFYLTQLRTSALNNGEKQPESPTPAQIEGMFNHLPLTLNARVANLNLTVAQLSDLKPGDIIPVFINDPVPVFIGEEQIFDAKVADERGKLFLCEIARSKVESSYD